MIFKKAKFYAHDIERFCNDWGEPNDEQQGTICGLYSCPTGKRFFQRFFGKSSCCLSCPVALTYEKKSGLPFKFIKRLGQGGFASVYEGDWNNQKSAFKVIPTKKDGNEYTDKSNGPYELWIQVIFNSI